ncbi:MAG: DUF6271 family protein [Clostridiales bacterium]
MKSVYYIPTNRDVKKSLESYYKEILYAIYHNNVNIPLVVVETNEKDFVKHNKNYINQLKHKHPELNIIHMTLDVQKQYFDILFDGKNNELKKIFLSTDCNYGTVMNKLFLMTSSFDSEAFHRRDSDTRLMCDEAKEEIESRYPIEIELKYLGKPISSFSNKMNINSFADIKGNQKICIVGGNYFGEWNLELKDFARKSYTIMYQLLEIVGFKKEVTADMCLDLYQFDKKYDPKDSFSIVNSLNDSKYPDCGNLAVYKIHEYLPALQGKNTIASDYFTLDTAVALGLPLLHHNRDVYHEYHTLRDEFNKKLMYWKGMIKFVDFFNLYMKIYTGNITNGCDEIFSINAFHQIKIELVQYISQLPYSSQSERVERIQRLVTEILFDFNDTYKLIGNHILKNIDTYIEESNREYIQHARLINEWPDLIKRAKNIYIPELLSGNKRSVHYIK